MMNERIRELAEQCGFRSNPDIYDRNQSFDIPKFAELIVRECMMMSDELQAQYLKGRKSAIDFNEKNIYAEAEVACDVLKYKMKKHFGVE